MFERIPLDDAVKRALDALGPVRLKGGNAYANLRPSQQKGTSGQRRLRRQQEAARMRELEAAPWVAEPAGEEIRQDVEKMIEGLKEQL